MKISVAAWPLSGGATALSAKKATSGRISSESSGWSLKTDCMVAVAGAESQVASPLRPLSLSNTAFRSGPSFPPARTPMPLTE